MAANVVFKIVTALGALYSSTPMGPATGIGDKRAVYDMALDKGGQLSDIRLQEICSNEAHYVYEKGKDGSHIVTCKLPGHVKMEGGKLRFKSKKSKKTKKRKTLKKKRKQTKKRKSLKKKRKTRRK